MSDKEQQPEQPELQDKPDQPEGSKEEVEMNEEQHKQEDSDMHQEPEGSSLVEPGDVVMKNEELTLKKIEEVKENAPLEVLTKEDLGNAQSDANVIEQKKIK